MKHLTAIIAALAVLTACSPQEQASPPPEPKRVSTPAPRPPVPVREVERQSPEELYVIHVRGWAESPWVVVGPDENLLQLGDIACDIMRSLDTADEVAEAATALWMSDGTDSTITDYAAIFSGAGLHLCPDQRRKAGG